MNLVSFICDVTAPGGLWYKLIDWFQGGIGNFGWTILLLTIIIKLIMTPIDFLVKYSTKKQTLIQQKCAPQVEKLKKKFGKDQNMVKVQTQSLYKREGLKTGAGCIIMLINLVLTIVIFFTFYASLRKASAYQAIYEYEQLNTTFYSNYYSNLASYSDDDDITLENAEEITNKYVAALDFIENNSTESETQEQTDAVTYSEDGETQSEETENSLSLEECQAIVDKYKSAVEYANSQAETATLDYWNNTKATWLWIDNIWVADAKTSPFPTYSGLVSLAKNGGYTTYVSENIVEQEYNSIANLIDEQGSRSSNGYYILAVLAAVVTFLSQFLAELHNKLKNKKANTLAKDAMAQGMGGSMKIMKFVMPVIMLIFVLTTTASFGIYILASNIASIVFGELVSLIVNALTKNKQQEVEAYLAKEADRRIKKGKLQEK